MVRYLKKSNIPETSQNVTEIVGKILQDIEKNGEQKAIEYAAKLDNWHGKIIVSEQEIKAEAQKVPTKLKEDIMFSQQLVKKFAEEQKATLRETSVELVTGLTAGQKLIPVQSAGCYVPAGRYCHIASAIMSVTTAKVAGVKNIVCASLPSKEGMHPAMLYTLNLCGADSILAMGGVQAVASMAFGYFGNKPVDILVGPGNQFVAEAKKILYGSVGIDMFAGPTEILIIADESADAEIIAYDLVGQAEHGYNSPAWLITTSEALAKNVVEKIPSIIAGLPELNCKNAEAAWKDYGEIILVDNKEEAVEISDTYASEHLEVHCKNLDWWLENLSNYGSLFLGEETTVAFGDKSAGTNHILPTKKAARYTGGLSVSKFLKTVTWQKMTKEAVHKIAPVTARISRLEGMESHAKTADIRLKKYFPDQVFDLNP